MFYSPHSLLKRSTSIGYDEDGFASGSEFDWDYISDCRCDDDSTTEVMDERGHVLRASFHIVLPKTDSVERGDYIRVPEKGCEGIVRVVKSTNYLDYTELWI